MNSADGRDIKRGSRRIQAYICVLFKAEGLK